MDGVVQGLQEVTTQAHVGDRQLAGLVLADDPVDACDHIAVAPVAAGAQAAMHKPPADQAAALQIDPEEVLDSLVSRDEAEGAGNIAAGTTPGPKTH